MAHFLVPALERQTVLSSQGPRSSTETSPRPAPGPQAQLEGHALQLWLWTQTSRPEACVCLHLTAGPQPRALHLRAAGPLTVSKPREATPALSSSPPQLCPLSREAGLPFPRPLLIRLCVLGGAEQRFVNQFPFKRLQTPQMHSVSVVAQSLSRV